MTDVHILDPLTFPLVGQQLIEASAGTGKTYTITALYLRLLLGLGEATDKPLGPDQILVVTFTEAATEELRDRIRERIVAARNGFLQETVTDPFLQGLKQQVGDLVPAIKLLTQAVQQMDEAAIFTIHGFCQRMLKRHAFESGSLFDTELTQDDQSLIRNAVLDFWRSTIYPLNNSLTNLVFAHCWQSPEQLIAELRGMIGRHIRLVPDLADVKLQQAYAQRLELIDRFKQAWRANEDDLLDLIQNSGINKRSYTKTNLPKWLVQIDQYAESAQVEPDKALLKVLARFTQSALNEKATQGEVPEHALFVQLEQLLASPLPVKEILLARALREVEQRMARAKSDHQLQTFDDLLTGLSNALDSDKDGHLSAAIRGQFPVALIDEFQDTDPLQYGIFSRLYADPCHSALVMIGDPKQAIYAFRGADIFTYIKARRAVSESYTLTTNWRSTSDMVGAVNQLFQFADSAFIYDEDIPFTPVAAADKSAARLTVQGMEPAALNIWHYSTDEPLTKGEYLSIYAQATAAEIDRLLNDETWIGERRVQGADIAVLVRDRYEAEEIRRALAVYEHPCVYLSNQDSVFSSVEALELSLILAAIDEPQNERVLRAALATGLLQLDMTTLDQLNRDELAWEAIVEAFEGYKQCWHRLGILPALKQLIHQRNLPSILLAQPGGERCLTNLLHLAEMLQQASIEVAGHSGLIRWFNEQVANPVGGSDEKILRLESEKNLLKIVTVHKAKGLEYPIVFLPFAASFREQKTAFYHDEQGDAVLDLSAAEAALQSADRERLAEELRLLYVALTRSVYRCYLGVADIRIGNSKKSRLQDSAIGYLLLQSGNRLDKALEALAQEGDCIEVSLPPDHGAQKDMFTAPVTETPAQDAEARCFNGVVDRSWRVSSYSALSRHSTEYIPELPGLDLEVSADAVKEEQPADSGRNIFNFPKGANAGIFLHSVFEEIDFYRYLNDPAAHADYQKQICQQLAVAGYDDAWLPVIDKLVVDVLSTGLNPDGIKLGDVRNEARLVEMEFMLKVEQLKVAQLESLIRRFDPLSAQARPLAFEPLQGMLKGFIDLLFRADGRYYVLDYKSNHLGNSEECYTVAALQQSMAEHRYDLQYLLYSLAVHRLLKQRIADYDYDQYFGGVFYLFLRGMTGAESTGATNSPGVFYTRPDRQLIEALDRLFAGEGVNV
ncbi:MAG: exodeoxyribonuclease V subunit beta [Neptuniibacter caesariensis]|uniref:RecBCD enzyme subunit RecB n=1 Tax=Neptuniibacter caesariensis TaxID=207954 RepID=A0A2G6JP95_NEPCE|nr:MAG: exodeoxyribonuclease V subunit beta [Neptuniibacter caesariensis]